MHLLDRSAKFQIPVWLDCDPGNDDAFAILLAAFSPYIKLVGISTVHGNVLLDKTTHNALALLDVLGFHQDDIKVYSGSARPLVVDPIHAEHIHGASGIGGAVLPAEPRIRESTDVDYLTAMRNAIKEFAGNICVVCTGALTNFAKLIQTYPDVCSQIRYVSIMGGAIKTGNITPFTEFNIHCDPHAAAIVFQELALANKTILCPLNITHTVLANKEVRETIYSEFTANNSELRHTFSKILSFYSKLYEEKYHNHVGPPVHDPLAVFLVLAMVAQDTPRLSKFATKCNFVYLQRRLKVVLEGENMGETIIENGNMDPLYKEEGGVYIGLSINNPFYWGHVFEALEYADEQVGTRLKIKASQKN